MKTNFDDYLAEQLKDPGFAERFTRAGKRWDALLSRTERRSPRPRRRKQAPCRD